MQKKQLLGDKFILAIIFLSFLVLGVGILWAAKAEKRPQITVSEKAKVEIAQNRYSWGRIPINGGSVKKRFTIKNKGRGTLKIFNIKTSCMCTTARIFIKDEKSPPFGMHSRSAWVGEIPSGKEAVLEVVFDPAYHGPAGLGSIVRQVNVSTNDPKNPQLTFTLTAKVVDKL